MGHSNGELLLTYHTADLVAQSTAWSPDESQMAAAPDAQTEDGSIAPFLPGDTSHITALCWSPDGRHLASASSDKRVCIWSLASEP